VVVTRADRSNQPESNLWQTRDARSACRTYAFVVRRKLDSAGQVVLRSTYYSSDRVRKQATEYVRRASHASGHGGFQTLNFLTFAMAPVLKSVVPNQRWLPPAEAWKAFSFCLLLTPPLDPAFLPETDSIWMLRQHL
jgi:hypothetical protein